MFNNQTVNVENIKGVARNIEDKVASSVHTVREEGFVDNIKLKFLNVVNKGKEFIHEIDQYDNKENQNETIHKVVDEFNVKAKENQNGEEETISLINVKDIDPIIVKEIEIMKQKKLNDPFAEEEY